jgi:chromosome segregation ATPase
MDELNEWLQANYPGEMRLAKILIEKDAEIERLRNDYAVLKTDWDKLRAEAFQLKQANADVLHDMFVVCEMKDKSDKEISSLRLELEAERHNHSKDNEHFMAEIERLRALIRPFEHAMEKVEEQGKEIEHLRTRYDFQVDANRSLVEATGKAMDMNERLRAALRDLVNRWSTKRGFDSAIQRAQHILEEKP